jgi:hypothetical protein
MTLQVEALKIDYKIKETKLMRFNQFWKNLQLFYITYKLHLNLIFLKMSNSAKL